MPIHKWNSGGYNENVRRATRRPYLDKEYCYNNDTVSFEFNDHENLCDLLKVIKGKFLLSYYEHPVIREMYKDFNIITKEVPKHSSGITVNSKHRKKPKAVELLIKNY